MMSIHGCGDVTVRAAVTFDVESDCPGVADSYLGVKKGLPRILRLLREMDLQATFFVTGRAAQRFPDLVESLASKHEIACHGLTHTTLDGKSPSHVLELRKAKRLLEEVVGQTVEGFRAPRLRISSALFPALSTVGFRYDSSQVRWLPRQRKLQIENISIREFPLSLPNVFLRSPGGLQMFKTFFPQGKQPLTLYFHPSEAIPMIHPLRAAGIRSEGLLMRPDRWVNTGTPFIQRLEKLLRFLRRRRISFAPLRDYV